VNKSEFCLQYYSYNDISKPRTNSLSDIHFCEGFSQNNIQTRFFAFKSEIKEFNLANVKTIYDLKNDIQIRLISIPFFIYNRKFIRALIILYTFFSQLILNKKVNRRETILGSRNSSIVLFFIIFKKLFKLNYTVFLWLHEVENGLIDDIAYKYSDKLLFTNSKIKRDIEIRIKRFFPPESVTLNPITQSLLEYDITKENARELIGYNSNKKLIVYTGKLHIGFKEIEYIIESAKSLKNFNFIITGGKKEALDYFIKYFHDNNIHNIGLTGFQNEYSSIYPYQKAADILISYYSRHDHYVNYNFPQKMLEYMVTGNIIITPKFEATDEIVNETNVFLVEADNPKKLKEAIEYVLNNYEKLKYLGSNARKSVKDLTFKIRTGISFKYLIDD